MNVDDKIKKTMALVLGVGAEQINIDSNKDNVEGWDSLKHMNLLLALEQEFQIMIPDEDAANLTSYKLIRLVVSELAGVQGGVGQ